MRLPKQRLIVGGVDLSTRFGLAMTDDYTLSPPEVVDHYVDIPGGNRGPIDLTSEVFGDSQYGHRNQEFVFAIVDSPDFELVKTRVSNYLHGKTYDYEISFDPGYVYRGKFAVDEYYSQFRVGYIKLRVTAEPFKSLGKMTYRMNALGGKAYSFPSGRMPVRPTIECDRVTTVSANGKNVTVPPGTWVLNDFLFTSGDNALWINSCEVYETEWAELGQGGQFESTWDSLSRKRWDEVGMMGYSPGNDVVRSWDEASVNRWSELSTTKWRELNSNPVDTNTEVYLQYEWKDL